VKQQKRFSTRARLNAIGSLAALSLTRPMPKIAAQEHANTHPNIVVIVTDDMRTSEFSALERTTELMGTQGTTFPNFFVTTPQCSPSRTSILTGLYAHNHGVRQNGLPLGGWDVFHENHLEERTIAEALNDVGYHTIFAGKYVNGFPVDGDVPVGWDEFYATGEIAYTNFTLNENGVPATYAVASGAYSTDVLLDKLLHAIDSTPNDTPLFLLYAPAAPHSPARPAARHDKAFRGAVLETTPAYNEDDITDKPEYVRKWPAIDDEAQNSLIRLQQKRLASLLAVDEAVGSLWDALATHERLANSSIFFLSDNGYLLGEHRAVAKQVPYDAAVRIQMLVYGPGFEAGAVDNRLIANIDIAPTLASIAGISAFPADGISLVDEAGRDALLIENHASPYDMEEITADSTKRWPPTYQAVRTDRYLYVEYETGERELYDYEVDPFELDNLIADWEGHAPSEDAEAVADRLRARLNELRECSSETCR
jgi:N-acetylglucosamine-6-sulfatase